MTNKPEESDFTKLCKELEHFETPLWAAEKILTHELMTGIVLDPCCGIGILSEVAKLKGYSVASVDIQDWGYVYQTVTGDFLSAEIPFDKDFSVFMNPPFSKACEFVEKAFELGARKVICFQRMAWWESGGRKDFWDKYPPNRIYICADRASCWRHDIPPEERTSGSPTAHGWFIWERGHPAGTILGHIRKEA